MHNALLIPKPKQLEKSSKSNPDIYFPGHQSYQYHNPEKRLPVRGSRNLVETPDLYSEE